MSTSNPLQQAIDRVGLTALAQACGVTYQAVRKWSAKGRMPRTEWTGETNYAAAIATLCQGEPTRDALLAPWPKATVVPGQSGADSPPHARGVVAAT